MLTFVCELLLVVGFLSQEAVVAVHDFTVTGHMAVELNGTCLVRRGTCYGGWDGLDPSMLCFDITICPFMIDSLP